ncbi:hypothetical protein BZL29_7920 [Mycobacterium kansasii]|uniref:Uncharacterized protein n=1 Tax=Mycobacterium kansasii TaxID=1768 RepID=A0A1V3WER0_MYCKA|nr:hypothetical protein BZL29_7920 [Mycobacterium kansasii]
MTPTDWIVHPNRSDIGPDKPGQNAHYRSVNRPRKPAIEPCLARVRLPRKLSDVADADGTVTFGGNDWWFVVGAARTFARAHVDSNVPPPFGFKRNGRWWWWDDTTSEESILDGPEGIEYVREYLAQLFPGCTVTISDTR